MARSLYRMKVDLILGCGNKKDQEIFGQITQHFVNLTLSIFFS